MLIEIAKASVATQSSNVGQLTDGGTVQPFVRIKPQMG